MLEGKVKPKSIEHKIEAMKTSLGVKELKKMPQHLVAQAKVVGDLLKEQPNLMRPHFKCSSNHSVEQFFSFAWNNDIQGCLHYLKLTPTICFKTDDNQRTALHFACAFGYLNLCRILIDHGANILHTDINAQTPISETFNFTKQNPHEIQNQQLIRLMDNSVSKIQKVGFQKSLAYFQEPMWSLLVPVSEVKDWNHYLDLANDRQVMHKMNA